MRIRAALIVPILLLAACESSSTAATPSPSPVATAIAPPILSSGTMVFDEASRELVLLDPSVPTTWTWDGVHDWRQQPPSMGPVTVPGRLGGPPFGMAWDPTTSSVIAVVGDMFVGVQTPAPPPATWSWRHGSWTKLDAAETPPAAGGAMAAFPPADQLVMFSGCCSAAPRQMVAMPGMWSWNGTAWTAVHPAHMPPARWGQAMVYDPAIGKILMYGGMAIEPDHAPLNDVWEWDGHDWSALPTPALGMGNPITQLAYARTGGLLLLANDFNGLSGPEAMWTFDGARWTKVDASTPACIWCELAYDPIRDVTVMVTNPKGAPYSANAVWTWNGVRWAERS